MRGVWRGCWSLVLKEHAVVNHSSGTYATLGCREESKVCLTMGVSQCLPSPVSPCFCGYLLSKTFPSPEGPGDSSDELRRLFSWAP